MLGRQIPKVEQMLREAADDLTAFADFPVAHWRQTWSTNPFERVNKEINRRTDVVGVSPNPVALLRLAGSVLFGTHDEWQVSDRRYLFEPRWPRSIPSPPTPAKEMAVAPKSSRHDPNQHHRETDPDGQQFHAVAGDPSGLASWLARCTATYHLPGSQRRMHALDW